MKRFFALVVSVAALATVPASAAAQGPVRVNGGGWADVTDVFEDTYAARFAIAGVINPNGTAHGSVNFVFGPAFSEVWAVPGLGVDVIHVSGRVTSASVAANGTITLAGRVTDTEIAFGAGVVFVAENEPFEIVIRGPGQFTLTWCLLPLFDCVVTNGHLHIR
jgi:hypothetical protein